MSLKDRAESRQRRAAAHYWKLRYEYGIDGYMAGQQSPYYRKLMRGLRDRYNATSRELWENAWRWCDRCQYFTRCKESGLVSEKLPTTIFGD